MCFSVTRAEETWTDSHEGIIEIAEKCERLVCGVIDFKGSSPLQKAGTMTIGYRNSFDTGDGYVIGLKPDKSTKSLMRLVHFQISTPSPGLIEQP